MKHMFKQQQNQKNLMSLWKIIKKKKIFLRHRAYVFSPKQNLIVTGSLNMLKNHILSVYNKIP